MNCITRDNTEIKLQNNFTKNKIFKKISIRMFVKISIQTPLHLGHLLLLLNIINYKQKAKGDLL